MQFYTGVENILERISMHNEAPLPTGPEWHVALLDRFRTPPSPRLPLLFDEALAAEMVHTAPADEMGRYVGWRAYVGTESNKPEAVARLVETLPPDLPCEVVPLRKLIKLLGDHPPCSHSRPRP